MAQGNRERLQKARVIVTRRLPPEIEQRMAELFDVRLNPDDHPFSPEELIAAGSEADILVPTVTDRLSADIIRQFGEKLRLIASFGAGTDHIDLEAARACGITVTNTPGVLTEDTADTGLALILATARRLNEGEVLARSGQWEGWAPTLLLGMRLAGKKLGILGFGRIGQAVARRARAFGLELHYHSRRQVHAEIERECAARYWPELEAMLAEIDILLISCPYNPETHHLLNRARLGGMKPQALLINISRGAVVDEEALAHALHEGTIGGCGLDVYEHEPKIHPLLLQSEKAVLLPHIGSATREGRIAMGERVLINIKTFTDGHKPPNRVLPGIGG